MSGPVESPAVSPPYTSPIRSASIASTDLCVVVGRGEHLLGAVLQGGSGIEPAVAGLECEPVFQTDEPRAVREQLRCRRAGGVVEWGASHPTITPAASIVRAPICSNSTTPALRAHRPNPHPRTRTTLRSLPPSPTPPRPDGQSRPGGLAARNKQQGQQHRASGVAG